MAIPSCPSRKSQATGREITMAQKIHTNILFHTYLSYMVLIWLIDFIDLICYFFNLPQQTSISRVIIIGIFIILFALSIKNFCFDKLRVNKWTFIGIIFITGFMVLNIVYPDNGYDTFNYHIISQNEGFTNYFVEHFGKGNFQVWSFRLGDRMFYLFREMLGYRMGVLLNYFVILLSYVQICDIVASKIERKASGIISAACGLAILLPYQVIILLCSYYVDLLTIPIGIEIIKKLFLDKKQDPQSADIVYFAFLNGIWLCFKMTNIIYIVPIVLMYIFIHKKKLSIYNFTASAFMAFLPASIYMIVNWHMTKNPVFPYFNSLFKSPYFPQSDFKDYRWGGNTLFEKILWVWYSVLNPQYKQAEINTDHVIMTTIGLVLLCSYALACLIWKKTNKQTKWRTSLLQMCIFVLCSGVLWGITTGYIRYFLFGYILINLTAVLICIEFCSDRFIIIKKVAFILFIALGIYEVILNAQLSMSGMNFSWNKWELDTFTENLEYIFNDKEESANLKEVDAFFISNNVYTGVADMLNPDVFTYSASYNSLLDDKEFAKSIFEKNIDKFKGNVYDIRSRVYTDIATYIDTLNQYSMKIIKFDELENNINSIYSVVQIKYADDRSNTVFISDDEIRLDFSLIDNKGTMTFICGHYYDWEGIPESTLKCFELINGQEEEIFEIAIDNVSIDEYVVDLETTQTNGELIFKFYNSVGELTSEEDINKLFMINPIILD